MQTGMARDPLAHVPMNCPKCNEPMEPVSGQFDGDEPITYIYNCRTCGPFHFSSETDLTGGEPG